MLDPDYFTRLADLDQSRHPKNKRLGPSQIGAWEEGLPVIADDLLAAGLGNVEVFVEYSLPATGIQPDVVLAGRHPVTGEPSYVVIELKRWKHASVDPENPTRCDCAAEFSAGSQRNPVYQVRGYCSQLLRLHGSVIGHPERVLGCAYLHNARMGDVGSLVLLQTSQHGLLFTGDSRESFREILEKRLASQRNPTAGNLWDKERFGGRVSLRETIRHELAGTPQFQLTGNQGEAYHAVLHAVEARRATGRKQVVVITGAAGTGKSAIANRLHQDLRARGHNTELAITTSAYRAVVRAEAPRGTKYLLQSPGAYRRAERDSVAVLICDEAHRIQPTSVGMFAPAKERAAARPQIEELIDAGQVSVFLLDQCQAVRPGDVGSIELISDTAHALGADVAPVVDLDEAFRCGGSRAFMNWVHRLFDLVPGRAATVWQPDGLMEVRTARNMYEMHEFLLGKDTTGNSARIAAGYAWSWSDPLPDGRLVCDIELEDGWVSPWNSRSGKSVEGIPSRERWAVDPGGFQQIGCIYTAQGLEYDWAGVLFGKDLVRRQGRWVAQPRESHDRRAKLMAGVDGRHSFELCLRNTYKVLMTRGMCGVVVHSVDAETQRYLEAMVNSNLTREYANARQQYLKRAKTQSGATSVTKSEVSESS
ncbi:DUF2075 domain-containing protein [Embleya sp. NBC_00888]|uniref:DNA/RNA helicase domain-containing protein n=1 Tax=Embleya sp. NBC_00888 TaxID=2975960 RepID=UPI00386BDC38|nr:DUF2075 domain-containing protein [Embleya sp. NBC_00888]